MSCGRSTSSSAQPWTRCTTRATISVDVPAELPPVEVDAAQTRRVLVNLLENAHRHARSATGVRVSAASLDAGAVAIRVEDDGPGIRPEDSEAVFEPFWRGATGGGRHGPRARNRARLRARERRHPSSRDGHGGSVARAHAAGGHGRWIRRDERGLVLVVDDEPQILRALTTSLRGAGFEVVTAATGEDALAQAATRAPDAVILDLVLPDLSGTEVCRELRTWSTVPVIVLSAVGEERAKVAALDAGADDYVTKPFGIDELLARLRAALRRTAGTQEPVVEIGDLRIDLEKRSVTSRGEPVQLTPHEYAMLALFARNPGKLLTHRAILREVWGPAYGRSPTTCTSTSRSSGARSRPTRPARATC